MSSMTGEVVAQAGDAFDVKWDDGRVLTGYNSKDFVEEGGNITAYTIVVSDDFKGPGWVGDDTDGGNLSFGEPGNLVHGSPLVCEDLSLDGMLGTIFNGDGSVSWRFVIEHKNGLARRIEVSEEKWQALNASKGTDGRVDTSQLTE